MARSAHARQDRSHLALDARSARAGGAARQALKQGRWRQTPEGHIEKGPFPAAKTSVNVTPLGTNRETGETNLSLTPRNAGDSPRVYVAKTAAVSEKDAQVQDLEDYRTTEATLYFIAEDSAGNYQIGEPTR